MALLITSESAFFLSRGGTGLTADEIVRVATSKWGYNLDVARALCSQSQDTRVGFVLLLVGIVLTLPSLLWPSLSRSRTETVLGIVLATLICLLVFLLSLRYSERTSAALFASVSATLTAEEA